MIAPDILDLSMQERATQAFRAAVEKVVRENGRLGLPVYVWREGRVVGLKPEDALLLITGESAT